MIYPDSFFDKIKEHASHAMSSILNAAVKPSKDPVKEFPEKIQPHVDLIGEVNAADELNALLNAIEENPNSHDEITNFAVKLLEKLTASNKFNDLAPAVGLLIRIIGANKSSGEGVLPFSLSDVMKNCSGIVGFANLDTMFAIASGMSKNSDHIKEILLTLLKENVKKTGTQCLITLAKVLAHATHVL